jgi:hypothetical protein
VPGEGEHCGAELRTVFRLPGRHGGGAQVAEVAEIGVGAEFGVTPTGSAATSATLRCRGNVGTSSPTVPTNSSRARSANARRRC